MRDPGTMLPADPIRHLLTLECADCCIGCSHGPCRLPLVLSSSATAHWPIVPDRTGAYRRWWSTATRAGQTSAPGRCSLALITETKSSLGPDGPRARIIINSLSARIAQVSSSAGERSPRVPGPTDAYSSSS